MPVNHKTKLIDHKCSEKDNLIKQNGKNKKRKKNGTSN